MGSDCVSSRAFSPDWARFCSDSKGAPTVVSAHDCGAWFWLAGASIVSWGGASSTLAAPSSSFFSLRESAAAHCCAYWSKASCCSVPGVVAGSVGGAAGVPFGLGCLLITFTIVFLTFFLPHKKLQSLKPYIPRKYGWISSLVCLVEVLWSLRCHKSKPSLGSHQQELPLTSINRGQILHAEGFTKSNVYLYICIYD